MKRYRLKELIPEKFYPKNQDEPLENKIIRKKIDGAQRIIEGQNFSARRMISKYAVILEQQRRIIYNHRMRLLFGGSLPGLFRKNLPERYTELLPQTGANALDRAERQVTLYYINKCWAEYLDYLSYIRESIHLVNLSGRVPVEEYNKTAVTSFDNMLKDMGNEITETLGRVEITREGVDMEKEGLKGPSSTWTYIVDDSPQTLGMLPLPIVFDPVSIILSIITLTFHRVSRNKKTKEG
jgi:preprotein translocase subunit SecA